MLAKMFIAPAMGLPMEPVGMEGGGGPPMLAPMVFIGGPPPIGFMGLPPPIGASLPPTKYVLIIFIC